MVGVIASMRRLKSSMIFADVAPVLRVAPVRRGHSSLSSVTKVQRRQF
jgi:hypothetical protein